MVGKLLLRGMIAGLLSALLVFAFARVYGEPEIRYAIGLEERKAAAAGVVNDEPELVSRETQAGIGLATGLLTYGAAAGGIFALLFAATYGRATQLRARSNSALLAGAAFVSVALVPQIKYPPTPPAVGSAETIDERTALFFIVLALSIAAATLAILLARRLWDTLGPWTAGTVAAGAWLLAVLAIHAALPAINEVPADFAADSLWRFRLASLGMHAILWAGIGLGFGAVAERLLERPRRRFPV